jgi:hypothetical protein
LLDHDPVVQRYRAFFALLDWRQVPERDPSRPWPGVPPHPEAAYVKALLVKVCEGLPYSTDLRTFLVEHPPLVLALGFRPVLDATQPYGFAVARTVPCARWLRHKQQTLGPAVLRALLRATVRALQAEIPGLGETVAVDVKHIYAWVAANNPKAYVAERHDPRRQPPGDLDCRLGAKRSSNQARPDGTTAGRTEWVWGYGSGVVAATDPAYGDVALAEDTQPFNVDDSAHDHPLQRQATAALGRPPTNVAADAAFDAWHIYQTCAEAGGLAAIPLNTRGHPAPRLGPNGRHLCPAGREMAPAYDYNHPDGFRARELRCPLLFPAPDGTTCDHPQFAKGPGCKKYINIEAGGRLRVATDRQAAAYQAVYRQRTAAERSNSQAVALGIERPHVRNQRSVANRNTLTYVVINARALDRVRRVNRQRAAPTPLLC